MGRFIGGLLILILLVLLVGFYFGFFDVSTTRSGSLPTVNVEGGKLPKFDADVADVDVGSKKKTIEVPDVEVRKPAQADENAE